MIEQNSEEGLPAYAGSLLLRLDLYIQNDQGYPMDKGWLLQLTEREMAPACP